jgi:hypothetical protein
VFKEGFRIRKGGRIQDAINHLTDGPGLGEFLEEIVLEGRKILNEPATLTGDGRNQGSKKERHNSEKDNGRNGDARPFGPVTSVGPADDWVEGYSNEEGDEQEAEKQPKFNHQIADEAGYSDLEESGP